MFSKLVTDKTNYAIHNQHKHKLKNLLLHKFRITYLTQSYNFSTSIKNMSEKIRTLPSHSVCISRAIFFPGGQKGHSTEATAEPHGRHSTTHGDKQIG